MRRRLRCLPRLALLPTGPEARDVWHVAFCESNAPAYLPNPPFRQKMLQGETAAGKRLAGNVLGKPEKLASPFCWPNKALGKRELQKPHPKSELLSLQAATVRE